MTTQVIRNSNGEISIGNLCKYSTKPKMSSICIVANSNRKDWYIQPIEQLVQESDLSKLSEQIKITFDDNNSPAIYDQDYWLNYTEGDITLSFFTEFTKFKICAPFDFELSEMMM